MMEYHVRYTIYVSVEADDPQEAMTKALQQEAIEDGNITSMNVMACEVCMDVEEESE